MSALSCPVCNAPFRETLKEGILIDTCTQCRGVWLDRGELEKLLALAQRAADEDAQNYVTEAPRSAPPRPMPNNAPVPNYPPQSYPSPKGYDEDRFRYGHKRDDDDDDDDRYKYRDKDDRYYDPKYHGKYRKKSKMAGLFDIFDFD